MNDNKPEILVVDDDKEAAQAFAELIQSRLRICTLSESDTDVVIDLVRKYCFKVIVLDQRMPKMSGTDLYRSIKKINPHIKAIMITGEADRREVADAMEHLGYVGFIEKNELENLHSKVIQAYAKYESDLPSNEKPISLSVYNPLKTRLFTKRYEIASIHVVHEDFVFTDKWQTYRTLEASEEEIEDVIQFESELLIHEERMVSEKARLSGHFKWLPSFKNELDMAIEKTFGSSTKNNHKRSRKIKTRHKLQDSVEEGKTAVKKVFEHSPVYTEYEILIKCVCRLCGHSDIYPITVYRRQPKVATRICIYYTDKTNSVIDTGSMTL